MPGMKTEENMGNLTICGWDLLKLWHTMEIMPIFYRNIMEISLEEDL
jgi:hypothetical protein